MVAAAKLEGAPAGNPWPCERCGAPIAIRGKRTGPSLLAGLVLLLGIGLILFAALRWPSGAGPKGVLAGLALVLEAALLQRARRRLWRCPECGREARARLRHAGAIREIVIIPTYNNVATIADVVRRAARAAPDLPILVIDDGSSDGTGERAREVLTSGEANGEVLRHAVNRGKGAALQTGFLAALTRGCSHAITLDGDGQHYPEDLPVIRAATARAPSALIVGARDLSAETVQTISRFGRRFSNFWLAVQTGVRLADSQSGFRVYPLAPVLSLGARAWAYDFEVEVLILAARAGIPLAAEPIHVYYPPHAERVSHFDKLWDNVRISWLNTRLLVLAPLWPLGWPPRLDRQPPPAGIVRAWSGKSRGGAVGHLIFFGVLKLLGRGAAYLLLYPVTFYFMLAARRTVRASEEFLEVVIGPAGMWRRLARTYQHLLTFAQCILDRAIVQVAGGKHFTWTSEGHEYLTSAKGAVLLSAHLGNYEVGGALLHLTGAPLNVVMLDAEAEAIKAVHARFGRPENFPKVIAINRNEFPAIAVLNALRSGELVALHGDRVIDDHVAECELFGKKARLPTGAFMMAAAAKVPIILTFGFKIGKSHYHFLAEPPRRIELPRQGRADALAAHVQWYASRLEHYARRYPHQWFNFYRVWD